MQPLRWERRPDGLRAPALVCAFKGWNDAGESATAALSFLGTALDAQRFATIDPEEFVDFQATRPTVRLHEGLTRHIDWPEFEVYEARIPRAPRDLILLSGPEPAIRWRTFCQTVVDLSEALGVQMVTSLGALLADVPHSRPVSVDRHRLRRVARRPHRPQHVELRRPDRHRRLPPGRRLRRRDPRRLAVGRGPALRRRRPEPEGRARAAAQARDAGRREHRRDRARDGRGRLRAPGLARGRDGPGRPGLRRAARARRRRGGAPPDASELRRGTCWRASSSGSCASAGRISRKERRRKRRIARPSRRGGARGGV